MALLNCVYRFLPDGALELDIVDMDEFLARYLDEDTRRTGSVWFELRRAEGLNIRVSLISLQ